MVKRKGVDVYIRQVEYAPRKNYILPVRPPDVPGSKDYCLIPSLDADFLEKIYIEPEIIDEKSQLGTNIDGDIKIKTDQCPALEATTLVKENWGCFPWPLQAYIKNKSKTECENLCLEGKDC